MVEPQGSALAVATRRSYAQIADVLDMPHFIEMQRQAFQWFRDEGLRELLDEISPIKDQTGSRLELRFLDYEFGPPKYSEAECRERDVNYAAPLKVRVQLLIKETGEIKEQDIFLGDFPLMTEEGTFVINGTERVVVSQLVRSPGVYFTREEDATSGRHLCYVKLIPNRGAWLEFETSSKDVISVKVDRKRKVTYSTLLRAIGYASEEELMEPFKGVDSDPTHHYMKTTIARDPGVHNKEEALLDLYRRLRPGDPPTVDNASNLLQALFFNFRRYDLGRMGRYKLNKRLGLEVPQTQRVLTPEDLLAIGRRLILINNGHEEPDDIDHLGNRRIRAVGELIQNQFRIGLLRMERMVKERMSIINAEAATPSALINIRPVVAALREFFGGSQLSQFMDQTNPLAELTHKRRLSALGPGGLSRERAGFEVRDVHHSHYGRICPIETPEGPNIGLIGNLATYARINEYGFIEAPYRKVRNQVPNDPEASVGRTLREAVEAKGISLPAGTMLTRELAQKVSKLPLENLSVQPFVSEEIDYLPADEEEKYVIAQANARLNERNEFVEERVEVREQGRFLVEPPERAEYMDVSPKQIVSVATSLIPFLEHDDANRALMGSNMQRQSVPLLRPEAPLIGTGVERRAAYDSGHVVAYGTSYCVRCWEKGLKQCAASGPGLVTSVSGREIAVQDKGGQEHLYLMKKFVRSNQGTCINHRPIIQKGDVVQPHQALADSSSTDRGELALGQNVLVAFMSWEGYNFEDAVVISQGLARDDKFTSVHIEKHEVEARDTKLGPEEITRDIPNVGEESLRDLDESGIIRVGAEVGPGDILVGKITPKGETELTAEEKLLRAIFGEKAREVKDTSLRVPHGEYGKVIEVRVFARANHDELPAGVNKMVRVCIAQKRKVCEGDKMAGRHGNKGVVARILPEEDMPFLPDGRPVQIILNPIGVPSRMNLGQILETHLGWAADTLGFKVVSPVFDGADDESIADALARTWFVQQAGAVNLERNGGAPYDKEKVRGWLTSRGYDPDRLMDDGPKGEARRACLEIWLKENGETTPLPEDAAGLHQLLEHLRRDRGLVPPIFGKTTLYDGRTGEPYLQPVTVGYIYMMKLIHLVEDKIHARSTGPYSLITQQPLGGKAQFGGQRFGEMEVWALEAYGAAHILQELLTVKSDDVVGRVKTYEAIVKGDDILEPGVPESFKVLIKELQSLGLSIEVLNEEEEKMTLLGDTSAEVPDLGINLGGFEERE